MNKFFIDLSLLAVFLFIAYIFSYTTTGLASDGNSISVGIKSVIRGEIVNFTYDPALTIGENQLTTVIFKNRGSVKYDVRIGEKIYKYVDTRLVEWAEYYDATVPLLPGLDRNFTIGFKPNETGVYYIQVKVRYSTRTLEVWGVFTVSEVTIYQPDTIIIIPGSPKRIPDKGVEFGFHINYPRMINIAQNESTIIEVRATNTGNVYLHEIRLYVSADSLIDINVSPKEIIRLGNNESALFLIRVDVPETLPAGEYTLDIEAISSEISDGGSIKLNVSAVDFIKKEDIYQKILNYELLIIEIERDILSASSQGIDVELANRSINSARNHLDNARSYYNLEQYNNALDELDKTEKDIMDALFQLTNASIIIYFGPAMPLFIFILMLIIIIAIIIIIYLHYKKKKSKRPRLLPLQST